MSLPPSGPGVRPKRSGSACHESVGRVSEAAVFTSAPTLTRADDGSLILAFVVSTGREPARQTVECFRSARRRADMSAASSDRIAATTKIRSKTNTAAPRTASR